MKKKIALVTEYGNVNIGNKLQNYALKSICESFGFDVVTFQYRSTYGELSQVEKMILRLGFPVKRARKYNSIIERKKRFEQFSSDYLSEIKRVDMSNIDTSISDEFDYFISGSDQVWHDAPEERLEYFFLRFAPREKRYCFAPSFGSATLPKEKHEIYKTLLRGFDSLCCREIEGCKLIEQISGKKAELICDPTIVVGKEVWDKLSKKPNYYIPEKYLLVYYLGEMKDDVKKKIYEYAECNRMKVIDILDVNSPEYYLTTPDEFIYLIQNSSHIVTNSFHGSVFAILYNKEFTIYDRLNGYGEVVMQSRINTLLQKFNLKRNPSSGEVNIKELSISEIKKTIQNESEKGYNWISRLK